MGGLGGASRGTCVLNVRDGRGTARGYAWFSRVVQRLNDQRKRWKRAYRVMYGKKDVCMSWYLFSRKEDHVMSCEGVARKQLTLTFTLSLLMS